MSESTKRRPRRTSRPEGSTTPTPIRGRYVGHPRGFGFLVVARAPGSDEIADLFVPPNHEGAAIDGDFVEAETRPKGTAKVTGVERRGRSTLVGTYLGDGTVEADDHRIPKPLAVTGKARKGDKVVVVLDGAELRVERVLGRAGTPEVEDAAVLVELEIAPDFPKAVLAETKKLSAPGPSDVRGRKDLRTATTVVTIDPTTSRDFDDAISLERRAEDWLLGVHIADVSHYVTSGSALDTEARARGTSVYLPSTVIPMLPEKLSNDLCSLRQGVDRLTMSVLLRYDAKGTLLETTFTESVIRSDRRFTYERASRVMDRTATPRDDTGRLLRDMAKLAEMLRKARRSLDVPRAEVELVYDAKGSVVDIRPTAQDVAHGVIEELMLAANREVARLLLSRGVPTLFRHHPEPSDFSDVRDALRSLGITRSEKADLGRAVARAVAKGFGPAITSAMFRCLPRAIYTTTAATHFALGFEAYTHFTSPIRRYSDLVVHRHLRELLRGKRGGLKLRPGRRRPLPAPDDEMEALAQHLSARADAADRAESRIRRRRVSEYLVQLGPVSMDAQITAVAERGLSVDLLDYGAWGFINAKSLPGGPFRLEGHALRGGTAQLKDNVPRGSTAQLKDNVPRGSTAQFALGDSVRVQLERADPATGSLDLRLE